MTTSTRRRLALSVLCLPLMAWPTRAGLAQTGDDPPSGLWPSQHVQIRAGEFTFDAVTAGPNDGEIVVMLHGFPQTAHEFRYQIPVLTGLGYRVIAFNQRGYSDGARPEGVEAYAMPNLVSDVIGIVDAVGGDDFHLVGHDWGAVVAWFTAMIHPNRVTSLFAISIAHPFAYAEALQSPGGEQAASSAYMRALQAPDADDRLLADDANMLRNLFAGSNIGDEDVAVYLDAMRRPGALNAALNWYRAMGTARSGALTPIRMPTTYVWGAADPTMSRHGAELTEKHVEGPYRFEPLEGIGHWIPEQATAALNQILINHFRPR